MFPQELKTESVFYGQVSLGSEKATHPTFREETRIATVVPHKIV